MKDILADLRWRGLIHQTTDDARMPEWLTAESRTLYCGFDPSADSLHVGSLIPLLMLRRFQRAGHRPIALVGGATGMIGDPSGKSEERNLLSRDMLEANVERLEEQMRLVLDFDDKAQGALLVNNYDWMRPFGYLDFLRDVGKHFPVSVMMAKDSVKSRLAREEAGISYTEFSYMLLQAYDFVYLYKQFGCTLQMGGSDQWGNITAGIDLARRMHGAQLHGLTWPLLTKSDGSKMGKTESGTVWLSPKRTSPYAFYQYWINVDDADAGRCLRMLTELEHEEIETLDSARANDPAKRDSQKRLADVLTRMIHGGSGLQAAQRATEILFGAEVRDLSDEQLGEIFVDVPSCELSIDRLREPGLSIIDAFVESGLTKSKGETRRIIEQGGAYLNNRRVESIDRRITSRDFACGASMVVLRSGRKNYSVLRFATR